MNPSYFITWKLCQWAYATYFQWRVYHPERVPETGPVILASNHTSYIDPPLVGCGLDRAVNYMARESLFRYPVLGPYLRSLKAVPVDRDGGGGAGLKAILQRLKKGGAILLFPEGTRSTDGRIQRAKPGVGLIVARTNAPVVPVRVFGTFEAWGKSMKFPLPKPVAVKYGKPMQFEELREEAKNCSKERLKEISQEIADAIVAEIAKLEPCWEKTRFP